MRKPLLTGLLLAVSLLSSCSQTESRELTRIEYLEVKQEMYTNDPGYKMFSEVGKLRFMPLIIHALRWRMHNEVRRACRINGVRYRDFNRAHERYSLYRYPYTLQMEYFLTMAWEYGRSIDGPMVHIYELDIDIGFDKMKLFVLPEIDTSVVQPWDIEAICDSSVLILPWEQVSEMFKAADSLPRGCVIISEYSGDWASGFLINSRIKTSPNFSRQVKDSLLADSTGTLVIRLNHNRSGFISNYPVESRRQMLYIAQRIRRRKPAYNALVIAVEDCVLAEDLAWVVRKAGDGVEMFPGGIFIVPCSQINPGIIRNDTISPRDVPLPVKAGPIGGYFMDNFCWLSFKHLLSGAGWTL